jgi:Do/DeqQ family serine protease
MKSGAKNIMLKLLLAAGIGAGAYFATPQIVDFANKDKAQPTETQAPKAPEIARFVPASKDGAIASFAPIVKNASGAVVNVYARSVQKGRVAIDPFWGPFRIPDRANQSQGSGVIVRDDGVIVTNNHVVEGATELQVVLGDKREFTAKVLVADPRSDLAVLRIDLGGQKLPALKFADTSAALVGDQVLAIGNPFGVGQTVTSGIISALARTDVGITDYSFFIQTDASINPGNSGGALVDMQGNLVGINTAIFSQSGSSAGVGFAIPSEMVKRVVDGALQSGRIIRAWTGVKGQNITTEMAQTLSLSKPSGVLITDIYPNSGAANAGLKRGDVIVSFNGTEVADDAGLKYLSATKAPNEKINIEYYRNGAKKSVQLTLSELPGGKAEEKTLSGQNSFGGAKVAVLNPSIADAKGVDPFLKGVIITQIGAGTPAQQSGLKAGDIVLEIDNEVINTIADIEKHLGKNRQGILLIMRDGRSVRGPIIL